MPRRRHAPPPPVDEEWEAYDSADPALATSLLAPRYQVLRLLGRGAFGSTWHVREASTGREAVARLVHDAVARLSAALLPDYVVLGGGNATKLKELPPNCRVGENSNAFLGGFRMWDDAEAQVSSSAQAMSGK